MSFIVFVTTRHSNLRCFQKIEYRSLYHVTIPDFGQKGGFVRMAEDEQL